MSKFFFSLFLSASLSLSALGASHTHTYPLFWGSSGILSGADITSPESLIFSTMLLNTFRFNPRIRYDDFTLIDHESWLFQFQWQQEAKPWGRLTFGLDFGLSYGGILDPMIDAFHGFFNMPNQGREFLPYNQNRIYFEQQGTVYVDLEDQSFFSPQVSSLYRSVSHTVGIFDGQVVAGLNWGIMGELPFEGSFSAGLGYSVQQTLFSFSWDWTNGLWFRTPAQPPWEELSLPLSYQSTLSMVYQAESFRLFMDFLFMTKVLDLENEWVGGNFGYFAFGLSVPLGRDLELTLSLWEEFLTWATMEVGIQAGVRWNYP